MNLFQPVSRSPQAGFKDKTSWKHAYLQAKHTTCLKKGKCGNVGKEESSLLPEEAEEGLGRPAL